jgi:hypothetical protein
MAQIAEDAKGHRAGPGNDDERQGCPVCGVWTGAVSNWGSHLGDHQPRAALLRLGPIVGKRETGLGMQRLAMLVTA